jgi:nucleotide-binding universal stress UspA family protein
VAGERVVCGLDGSTRAESMLAAAAGWSRTLDVPLWLVRAVPHLPPLAWDEERSELERVAAALAERGVAAERELVGEQRPSVGLVTWLNERPGTMAVLTTHGTTGLAAVTLGGTAGAVVRKAQGPLLLRRPADLGHPA